MKKLTYAFIAFVTVLVTLGFTIQAQTLVSDWGKTSRGTGWPILNTVSTPAGDASMGAAGPPPTWATIRGQFAPIELSVGETFVISGKLEYVGAGPGASYVGLRYALTFQDSTTLNYQYTDSAMWVSSKPHYGYELTPRSGATDMANGTGGVGVIWTINGGNGWNSTYSNNGYPFAIVNQAPALAEIVVGVYNWAISVQSLSDGSNEIRWYLVEENNQYWFGGTVSDTAQVSTKFNGICFGIGDGITTAMTQFKLTGVKVEKGVPITVPAAPWAPFYVPINNWGVFARGPAPNWKFVPGDLDGNAGLLGTTAPSGTWSVIRGGFLETVTATTEKAIIVTGKMKFTGAGPETWGAIRYGLFYHDSAGTVHNAGTDSAKWMRKINASDTVYVVGKESGATGYMFQPRSGANDIPSWAAGGGGTHGITRYGNWLSTFGNNLSAGIVTQKPVLAVADAGTYDFAFSVQPKLDGTKEVRFYFIKEHAVGVQTTFWWGGTFIDTTTIPSMFNGVVFGINGGNGAETGLLRGFDLIDVQVDLGDPITVPDAPWEDFYLAINQWGVIGGKTGGWKFIPGDLDGNAGIGGTVPNTDLAAISGTFGEAIIPPSDKILKFTGKIILEGGGFEGTGGLRFGLFDNDNAGSVQNAGTDSARLSRPENNHSGYLFLPRSGVSALPTWGSGGLGDWGAVVNSAWYGPDSTVNNYVLGNQVQVPADALASAGTYDFVIEVQVLDNGTNELGYSLIKDDLSYSIRGFDVDAHSPRATNKFNSISFALNNWSGSTTTALKVVDVYISRANSFTVPVELTSFTASINNLGVTLNWSTSTEKNNYGFEIQKKSSGGSFATIGFVKGQGTTTEKSDYSFIDKNPEAGKYFYRLKQVDFDGQFNYSSEVEIDVKPAYKFNLDQNYPNPFNPTTTISYTLPEKSMTKLVILNAIGEEVAVLLNEEQEAGYHKINFNGLNLTSGVYFYKLIAKDFTSVKKLMLVK